MSMLESETIKISGKSGIACLGSKNQIIAEGKYTLPKKFRDTVSFSKTRYAPVFHAGEQIGSSKAHKVINGNLVFMVVFYKEQTEGLYFCNFKLVTFFSEQNNDSFMLDEVILDSITINARID